MKRAPKSKIGRVKSWDEKSKTGWLLCQVSDIEHRLYYFTWRVIEENYFPIKSDRVRFEILAGKKGNVVQDVKFLRTC